MKLITSIIYVSVFSKKGTFCIHMNKAPENLTREAISNTWCNYSKGIQ